MFHVSEGICTAFAGQHYIARSIKQKTSETRVNQRCRDESARNKVKKVYRYRGSDDRKKNKVQYELKAGDNRMQQFQ